MAVSDKQCEGEKENCSFGFSFHFIFSALLVYYVKPPHHGWKTETLSGQKC